MWAIRETTMAAYIIGFDLHKPGQGYSELNKALESYGTYFHILDSTWIVVSDLNAEQIRDHLIQHIDENDRIIVIKSGVESAWRGFTAHDWLKKYL